MAAEHVAHNLQQEHFVPIGPHAAMHQHAGRFVDHRHPLVAMDQNDRGSPLSLRYGSRHFAFWKASITHITPTPKSASPPTAAVPVITCFPTASLQNGSEQL